MPRPQSQIMGILGGMHILNYERKENDRVVTFYWESKKPTDSQLDAEKSVGLSILLSIHKKMN